MGPYFSIIRSSSDRTIAGHFPVVFTKYLFLVGADWRFTVVAQGCLILDPGKKRVWSKGAFNKNFMSGSSKLPRLYGKLSAFSPDRRKLLGSHLLLICYIIMPIYHVYTIYIYMYIYIIRICRYIRICCTCIYIYICTMYTNIYMYYVYMYICTMYIYTHTWNTLATKVTFSISTDAEIGFLNLTSKALQCTGLNFSGRFQGADWEPEGWLGFWRVTHPTWWVMRLFYMFRVKIPVMISVTSKFLKSNKNGQTSRKNRYNVWDDRGFWYLALD